MLAVFYYKSAYLNKTFKLQDHGSWNKGYFQIDKNV